MSFRKILKVIAPKAFNDGLSRCNQIGKALIAKERIEKLLDLGCGDGRLTMEFAKIAKPKEVFGVEFATESIRKAKRRGINCIRADLNCKLRFRSNFFDLILSSQTIEHLHNTRLHLEECYRCLKKGGQLIILTENLSSLANVISLAFGWQPFSTTYINGWNIGNPLIWHLDEKKDEKFLEKYQTYGCSGAVGHVRVLSYRGLKELVEKTGFREVKVLTTGYLPFWGNFSDLLCKIDKRHGHFLIATGIKP